MEWLDELLSEKHELELNQIAWIEQLIRMSVYEEWKKCDLEAKVDTLTPEEYHQLTSDLKNNQIDPIDHGLNYNQGDIQKKLAQLK